MAMELERHFSADVLVDILLRLPPSSRRRARLVCRHWRDVVDERTTEMQSRPKLLIWHTNYLSTVAYVSDDLPPSPSSSSTGSCTQLCGCSVRWPSYGCMQLVGTCNGLLCLCKNGMAFGGAITVANPVTSETLRIQPLCADVRRYNSMQRWGDAYSFAYHPITGRYKVVHVPCIYPCIYQPDYEFDTVHVLTLGENTWREVPVGPGGVTCKLVAGIVSVDGMTYWVRVTEDGVAHIVSFDLMDERIVSTTIPVPVRHDYYWLSEVRGKLSFVTWYDVWVLEEGRRWSHRYNFTQGIPRPHFVYGEYVLMSDWLSFCWHRAAPSTSGRKHVARVDKGTMVAKMTLELRGGFNGEYETFSYVETTEPLSIYVAKQ